MPSENLESDLHVVNVFVNVPVNCNGLDLISHTVHYVFIMTTEDAKDAEVERKLFTTSASSVSSVVQLTC